MKTKKIAAVATLLFAGQAVHAGQVGNLTTFVKNTPAKADEVNGNFNAVKSAVDDNDSRITGHETRLTNVETAVAGGGVKGALLTMFGAAGIFSNRASDTFGYSGYYPLAPQTAGSTPAAFGISAYTLPQGVTSAKAHVQTTCSFDGSSSSTSQALQTQAVIRSPSPTTPPTPGSTTNMIKGPINGDPNFATQSGLPGASIMVQNSSFDYFDLTAGNTYDFGVWFSRQTPYGTNDNGYCSILVSIYRQ